jgi:hypothetical protein
MRVVMRPVTWRSQACGLVGLLVGGQRDVERQRCSSAPGGSSVSSWLCSSEGGM